MKKTVVEKLNAQIGCQQIYIYGAGLYGKMLYFFLRENIKSTIAGFIVSNFVKEKDICGTKVWTLEDYMNFQKIEKTENVIIIAVSDQYKSEIIQNLCQKGVNNFISFSNKEWECIEMETTYQGIVPFKNIAILMYHRVIENDYNFWKLNVSPKTFDNHMKYISENYHVLKLDDNWKNTINSNEKYVVITFDDGYVDNYKNAFPVLEKYKIPATVFVSTDLIDTNKMYWWDELEKIFILDQYKGIFDFEQKKYEIYNLEDRKAACLKIRNYLKNLSPNVREQKMNLLRNSMKIHEVEIKELRCMTSNEIRKMSQSEYMTIGCHTKSHLSMGSNKSIKLMKEEIKESKKILENITDKKIDIFAYPFGSEEDCCDMAESILTKNGIKKTLLVKNGNINVENNGRMMPRHMMFDTDDISKKLKMIWGIYGW